MDINEWVKKTDLASPITEQAVLLVGRDGVSPTKAIGSGVFVADRLIMTVKHVVQGYWQLYGNPNVKLERRGKKTADFELFAVCGRLAIAHNQFFGPRARLPSAGILISLS